MAKQNQQKTPAERYGDRAVSAVVSQSSIEWMAETGYKKSDLICAGLYWLRRQDARQLHDIITDAMMEKGHDAIVDRYYPTGK